MSACDDVKTNKAHTSIQEQTVQDTFQMAKFHLLPVAENLQAPVFLTHCGDERLFVLEQPGIIRIIKNGKVLAEPFLDLSAKVEAGKGYSEKGLLGMAFHPEYKENGRFYLYYSAPEKTKGSDHKSVISQFQVSVNPDKAGPAEKVIMEFPQPQSNHNGGMIAFGPDGWLYIASGDGGGAGDKHGKTGNAQDLTNLLGKILRVDVNSSGGKPYAIPPDNPFINDPKAKPEIFAYGLRNPWRFSFDRKDGTIYCGDVGQNEFEEINVIEIGRNYGWRAMEGNSVFDKDLQREDMVAPIHDYPRSAGITVIGGYVYRGKKYPSWEGKYFFADWNGSLFYLEQNSAGQWSRTSLVSGLKPGFTINSFGEGSDGELYITGQQETGPNSTTGAIYRLTLSE